MGYCDYCTITFEGENCEQLALIHSTKCQIRMTALGIHPLLKDMKRCDVPVCFYCGTMVKDDSEDGMILHLHSCDRRKTYAGIASQSGDDVITAFLQGELQTMQYRLLDLDEEIRSLKKRLSP